MSKRAGVTFYAKKPEDWEDEAWLEDIIREAEETNDWSHGLLRKYLRRAFRIGVESERKREVRELKDVEDILKEYVELDDKGKEIMSYICEHNIILFQGLLNQYTTLSDP